MTHPTITRSYNQSTSRELYRNPPITLPNPNLPLLPQFNTFLAQKSPSVHMGEPLYGPYGDLGQTEDPPVVEIKQYLSQLPPTISLEARAVLLTTFLRKFHPFILDWRHNFPPTYDIGRDRHLAQNIYGGNGLYNATEEWIALAKGKYPGIQKKVKLPWLAMHIRHTLLKNSHLIESHADVQTAIDILEFFMPHFKLPNEDMSEYIDRMSQPYWQAHWQLQQLNLIPKLKPEHVAISVPR